MNNENKLEKIVINNIEYYSSKELKEKAPSYFRGVRSLKNIIEKKNIPEEEYIFGSFSKVKNNWKTDYNKKTNIPSRAYPLLSVKWCHKNVPFFKENDLEEELPIAPDILVLNDNEKFKDNEGNIYEIETRGKERTIDSVYFLCKDVSSAFGIKSARDNIIDSSHFVKNKDYINFSCKRHRGSGMVTTKCLFLTYYGVLRLLYRSNCKKANTFTDWASKTLFTVQMGTKEQKQDLASDILGISIENIKQLSKISVSKIPCVYVFSLGYVKDLRNSMNIQNDIDDNHIVIKFGLTTDLVSRASQHVKTYQENIENSKLRLLYYNYIDRQYMYESEKEIRDFFNDSNDLLSYKNHKELGILNPKNKKYLKSRFRYVNDTYSGKLKLLNEQFQKEIQRIKNDSERKITKLNHEKELMTVKFKAENDILKKEKELLEKDNKILQMEKSFLELKLKPNN